MAKSLFTALKRPIDNDTIEKVVSKISRELEELGQSEIQSNTIGKKLWMLWKNLIKLLILDLSVYTNFKEVGEFEEVIEELHGKSKNKNSNLHKIYLNLAFEKAKINLGKTKLNPTVGCVLVKNNSVISSGYTSIEGRPHTEYNALRFKKKFKNTDLYVTMEPCVHYGLTPPCTNLIKKIL